jgi:hypothetical protein
MDDFGRENFYIDRINAIMADIADGVESPEELTRLMADLQRYSQLLQGTMGERFYTEGYDQYVITALQWAQALANEYFEIFRLEIMESNQAIVDELLRIYELLTTWQEQENDIPQPGDPDYIPPGGGDRDPFIIIGQVDVKSSITVDPSPYFVTFVESIVDATLARHQAENTGIN